MKIAVYFDDPSPRDYPLNSSEYFEAYKELSEQIISDGNDFFIVRSFGTYEGAGRFKNSWKIVNGKLSETGSIIVDVLYDKGDRDTFKATDMCVINNRFINEVCADKDKTYQLFREYMPLSKSFRSNKELKKLLTEINTNKVVLKPKSGFAGTGVKIVDRNDAVNAYSAQDGAYILQEFIDTSRGIKGVAAGVHDLRLVVINGSIIISYVRIPKKGSLLANLAQGGSLKYIAVTDLPESIYEVLKMVEGRFCDQGDRIYSIDLAYDNERPYIIELNSRPGLNAASRGAEAILFQKKVAETLVGAH